MKTLRNPKMIQLHKNLIVQIDEEIKRLGDTNKKYVEMLKDSRHRITAHYIYNDNSEATK
jgi:hypothetical protein